MTRKPNVIAKKLFKYFIKIYISARLTRPDGASKNQLSGAGVTHLYSRPLEKKKKMKLIMQTWSEKYVIIILKYANDIDVMSL